MLVLPNTMKEETSYEILHQAAPILLRNRSARQIDVRLYLGSSGRDTVAPKHAVCPGIIPESDCSLPRRHGGCRGMHLYLVLARRSVCQAEYSFCSGARAVHESDPRWQGQERQDRCAQDRGAFTWRYAADGLCLSARDASEQGPASPPHVSDAQTLGAVGPCAEHQQPVQPP